MNIQSLNKFMIGWCLCFFVWDTYTMCTTKDHYMVALNFCFAVIQLVFCAWFINNYRKMR
jgi:hypothetical protein